LLQAGLLEYRQLTKIYRQTNPELLATVQDAAQGRYQESFDQVKSKWMHVEDNEIKLRANLVEAIADKYKRGEPVLAIALMHRQGEAIARDVRALLKEEGLLGKEDTEVKCLKDIHLTDAQRADAINFKPGQLAKFHQLAPGGFKSGQAWTVQRVENGSVIVSHGLHEKALPISAAAAFQVYEAEVMPVATGDMVQVTKNNPRAKVKTGELHKVLEVSSDHVQLDTGKCLEISEGVHLRQGYSVTSHGAQGHDAKGCYLFLPGSAAGMMNQRQWLVDISRAKEEFRMFTDCPELVEQRIVQPEEHKTALSIVGERTPTKIQTVDLQAGKRVGEQKKEPKEMKIEIRADADNHHDLIVNGKLYSRHADLEKAEQARDHLVADQAKAKTLSPIEKLIRKATRSKKNRHHNQEYIQVQTKTQERSQDHER
jgi:hypothetical protein